MFVCFLSVFVSIQVSDEYVEILSIIVFFSLKFSFLDECNGQEKILLPSWRIKAWILDCPAPTPVNMLIQTKNVGKKNCGYGVPV